MFELRGLAELKAALAGAEQQARTRVAAAINEAALEVREMLADETPKARTVGTANQWQVELASPATLQAQVVNGSFVMQVLEYGAGPAVGKPPFLPPPGVLLDWLYVRGIQPGEGETLDDVEARIRYAIRRRGLRPRFIVRGNLPRAQSILTAALTAAAKDVANG